MDKKTFKQSTLEDTIIELTDFFDAYLLSIGKTSLALRSANDLIKWEERFKDISLKKLLEEGSFSHAYQTEIKPKQWYIKFSQPEKFTELRKEYLKLNKQDISIEEVAKEKIKPKPQKSNVRNFVIIFFLLFIVYKACDNSDSGGTTNYNSSDNVESKKPEEMQEEAYFTAQEFMRNHLKSPASAEFPLSDYKFAASNNTYHFIIRSYVDAQNSFGANLRTYYLVQMKWNSQNWLDINNWELIDLEMGETEF
ncbi:MAG: hypothetical protein V4511_05985 [Bacteroidota bacterium]